MAGGHDFLPYRMKHATSQSLMGTPARLGGKISTACPPLTEVPETTNGRRRLHCSLPSGWGPFHHMNELSSPANHSAASHLPNAPCTLPTCTFSHTSPFHTGTASPSFTVWPKTRIQSRISLHGSTHRLHSECFNSQKVCLLWNRSRCVYQEHFPDTKKVDTILLLLNV